MQVQWARIAAECSEQHSAAANAAQELKSRTKVLADRKITFNGEALPGQGGKPVTFGHSHPTGQPAH